MNNKGVLSWQNLKNEVSTSWLNLTGLRLAWQQTEEERIKRGRDTRYFIHQEIASRETYKAFRDWISKSGWDKKIQEDCQGSS